MFEREHKLRHMPFFEAIASTDEGDANWHAATAGLVVLRLVDSWVEDGPRADDDIWPIESVRCSIDALNSHANLRSVLHTIVDVMETAGKADIHVVAPRLMAYGQLLEYDAQWALATDVYHTILAHVHPTQDSDASISAQLRLGHCHRNLNQLDQAALAFATAGDIARTVGDLVGVLRARIGDAKIAMVRGNLPHAERILDDTIERAAAANLPDVRSRALNDRASVAHSRGQYDLAIRFGYDALKHVQSISERDHILNDIAGAFVDLGAYSTARDAYLVLSATAQEQYVRWTAAINLMEIAWRTGVQPHFESYRRELSSEELPPNLATGYQLSAGEGCQRFGDLQRAQSHLTKALRLATEHQLNQYVFAAEEALSQLEKPVPHLKTPSELSLGVKEVAEAIRELRETVGV